MQQRDAINLIQVPGTSEPEEQIWIDLGCGTGTFTLALAHHLSAGSRIMAIDKDRQALKKIPDEFSQVYIEKKAADFIKDSMAFENLNGILMANSLHYVVDQEAFIAKFKEVLKPDGSFLIVEYDTVISNPWVPYPISFKRLENVFKNAGFSSIRKIAEKPSKYNRSNLYSALIR